MKKVKCVILYMDIPPDELNNFAEKLRRIAVRSGYEIFVTNREIKPIDKEDLINQLT